MQLTLHVAPSGSLVTLAEAKAHLRIEHTAEDAYLPALIATAEALVAGRDGWTGRALLTQTWKLTLPGFPSASCLRLPLPPLRSVTHVKYYDSANVQQTLSSADYSVLTADTPGRLELNATAGWPGVYTRPDAAEVQFEAGYGTAGDVPAPIKHAVLIVLGALYANRGDMGGTVAVPGAVRRLLASYKAWGLNDWG